MPLTTQTGLLPSLLDRLEAAGQASTGAPWYGPAEMAQAVQRDLEELLNTRETHQGLVDDLPEARRSLLTFGLPDLASLDTGSADYQQDLAESIEAAVRFFEPRLTDVRAVPLDTPTPTRPTIRFRIAGKLRLEPAPAVAFDTTLELASGHYSVELTSP